MDIQKKKLKKNIVILGAGFAGAKCALELHKISKNDEFFLSNFNIVLIDKNNYHLYTPTLYEAATISKADASGYLLKKIITTPIEEIIKGARIKFIQGEISGVSLENKTLAFTDQTVMPFEYFVFAVGAEPSYFGIEGLKENSLSLKWLQDAIKIRSKIRSKFMEKKNNESFNIIIGGSGPNGVEFSAELAGYIKELNDIHNKKVEANIKLVDGSPNVLFGFPYKVTKKASQRLEFLGIKTINGYIISKVDAGNVYIKQAPPPNTPSEGFMAEERSENYDVLIWSGGVEANNIISRMGMPHEKRGRVEIDQSLKCTVADKHLDIAEKMFAIGDNACFYDPVSKRPIPGTAKIAIEQAKVAARNIYYSIHNKPKIFYKYKTYPFSIPIGGKYAITKIGFLTFAGFFGWFLKQLIELHYFLAISNNNKLALWRWFKGLRVFSKND